MIKTNSSSDPYQGGYIGPRKCRDRNRNGVCDEDEEAEITGGGVLPQEDEDDDVIGGGVLPQEDEDDEVR